MGGPVNAAAWLYLPQFSGIQKWLAGLIVLVGMGWLPLLVVFQGWMLWTADRTPVAAIGIEAPYTNIEASLARRLFAGSAAPSDGVPIWDAPNDGYFGVRPGLPERTAVDRAVLLTRELRDLQNQDVPWTDDAIQRRVREVSEQLVRVGREQERDRGVVLYHRALIDTWRGSRGSATDDLGKLLELITDLEGRRLNRTQSARVRGVKAAALYARGRAWLVGGGIDDEAMRQRAIADFRASLSVFDAIEGDATRRGEGPSAAGPFVELEPARHVVGMSSAAVWNDLVVVLSLANMRAALAEIEPLIESPSYVIADPALSANVMALAVSGSGADTVSARRSLVEDLGVPPAGETAADLEARIRASAVRAIVGLQGSEISPIAAGRPSEVRAAYGAVFPAAINARAPSYFPPIDLPRVQGSDRLLDTWLFIREWREQLRLGDYAEYLDSFQRLRDLPDEQAIDYSLLADWRNEVMPRLTEKMDEAAGAPMRSASERRALFRLRALESGASPLQSATTILHYLTPWWLLLVALWIATIALAVFALWLLSSFAQTYRPMHHLARVPSG